MGNFIHWMHWVNIVFQALFSLLFPVALGTGGAYLLVSYANVGEWIYAVLILVGFLMGMISMIRFILIASRAVTRLEEEENARKKRKR